MLLCRPRSVEHKIKGQGLYAYVALSQGEAPSEALRKSLVAAVRQQIGAFAAPDVIHWVPGAPTARAAHSKALLQVVTNGWRVSMRLAVSVRLGLLGLLIRALRHDKLLRNMAIAAGLTEDDATSAKPWANSLPALTHDDNLYDVNVCIKLMPLERTGQACPRRAAARSCGASCARLQSRRTTSWAMCQPWQTPAWCRPSSRCAGTNVCAHAQARHFFWARCEQQSTQGCLRWQCCR